MASPKASASRLPAVRWLAVGAKGFMEAEAEERNEGASLQGQMAEIREAKKRQSLALAGELSAVAQATCKVPLAFISKSITCGAVMISKRGSICSALMPLWIMHEAQIAMRPPWST